MTAALYRAFALDTPDDPFEGGQLRAEEVALVVEDGVIAFRGDVAAARERWPDAPVQDLRDGYLLPGLVDTHVHHPQARMIGTLGMPLLDWLSERALPEEARMADPDYALGTAHDLLHGLARSGTTSALVFGAHVPAAVDTLFAAAAPTGLRVTTGLVVGDVNLRPELHTTPQRAHDEGAALLRRWHGHGRLRYAVTPRFALGATEELLAACAALLERHDDVWFTTHLNESPAEVAAVAARFPGASSYLDTYDAHGLINERSVLAHDVHPTDAELRRLAQTGAVVAHCPTSNAALGSGLFPMRRHLDAGVRLALGSDVGAGTGFSLLKEGLQAYFAQRLLGDVGYPLRPAHLLRLATRSGALALGLADVGHLGEGMAFDAVLLRPAAGSALAVTCRHARDADDLLGSLFVLGTDADVAKVWVAGESPRTHPAAVGSLGQT